MLSYRDNLSKIGIAAVPYEPFYSKPQSLREAIRSMDAPASGDWSQLPDIFRDDYWTDEVQGVAWDGLRWIFSTNAAQWKPDVKDKAIYVFSGHTESLGGDKWLSRLDLGDGKWSSMLKYKDVPHPIEADDHWGQLCYWKGRVYVSHWWKGGPKDAVGNVVVFEDMGGGLEFIKWIELEKATSPTDGRQGNVEFQAINPWDGMLYTCFRSDTIHEFFLHDMDGRYKDKTLKFDTPISEVQGACFSPNGHLYIASNAHPPGDGNHQTIWCYSALNGHRFGFIPVLAEEDNQELEGICYANVQFSGGKNDGKDAQIHAVLVENPSWEMALDNIFFKSFSLAKPDIV
jgi:hypothetical protein